MRTALGTGFRRLWAASAISNLGDGVYATALPLLAATLTRDPQRLQRANGRLVGAQVVTQELAGPPAGGFLFGMAAWIPFAVDALSFAAGSALVAAIRGRFGAAPDPGGRGSTLRSEIGEGLRWLAAHRVLRTTAVMVAVVNLLASGGGAVMVLFAQEKLGLDAVGFGLLFSGGAVGGVLGSLVATRLARVVGTARLAIGTMVVSALAYLAFGLSSAPWLAGVMFGLVGLLTVVFNVVLGSLRQALTPDRLLGRVISAFRLFGYGVVPLGSLLGGAVAAGFGLRAPFVLAGVVIPVTTLLCLPALNERTLAAARAAAAETDG